MNRVYRYVITHDRGMAPCVCDGLLSLVTCKPQIRRVAKAGEWVLAFASSAVGQGKVLWVGQISTVQSMGDYYDQFAGKRPDAVYKRTGMLGDSETLVNTSDWYHQTPEDHRTDCGGRNALLFQRFWYWGRNCVDVPDEIRELAHYYPGYKAQITPEERKAFLDWIGGLGPGGKLGDPIGPVPDQLPPRVATCARTKPPLAPRQKSGC